MPEGGESYIRDVRSLGDDRVEVCLQAFPLWRLWTVISVMCWLTSSAFAQKSLTWEQAKREFEASNPTLRAAQVGIQESRAQEVTAF